MHADLQSLLSSGKINEATASRLDLIAPGRFVMHKSWGAGKVSSWNLASRQVTIDFETKDSHTMDLKFALSSLEGLADDHFRSRRFEELDELRALAKKDPVELMRRVLLSYGHSMRLDDVDQAVCPVLVAEEDYKKWWEAAKRLMREDHRFVVPSKRTEPLQLRTTDLSPAALLLMDYKEARDFKSKVKVMETIVTQSERMKAEPDQAAELYALINEDLHVGLKLNFQSTLELAVLRNDLANAIKIDLPDLSPDLADLVRSEGAQLKKVLGAITGSRQAKIFQVFPSSFGDHWVDIALDVFDKGGPRAVTEAARFIVEKEKLAELKAFVQKTLSRHTTSADALIWICRERKRDAEQLFSLEVGTAILSLLERDQLEDGPMRNGRLRGLLADDRDLIPDLISGSGHAEVRNFARRLMQSAAFPEQDRLSLLARIIKVRPEMQELLTSQSDQEDDGTMVVSWESLEKKKAEFEDITKNRIPENTREISIARAHGDLRENFEYKAAKDMQLVLMRRKSELERDISLARGTDFKGADTSVVSVGTRVQLSKDSGESVQLTILGAWDSDPASGIISCESEIAKALIGKKIGESVEFADLMTHARSVNTIVSIEAVNP